MIVGVSDKDRLPRYAANSKLLEMCADSWFYAGRRDCRADCVREVMEETELRVKNIRYYKSQPWGFSGGLLLGCWAELDRDDAICLDEEELCEGRWMTR